MCYLYLRHGLRKRFSFDGGKNTKMVIFSNTDIFSTRKKAGATTTKSAGEIGFRFVRPAPNFVSAGGASASQDPLIQANGFMGFRSPRSVRDTVKQQIYLSLGIEAVRGIASLRIQNLAAALTDFTYIKTVYACRDSAKHQYDE